MKRLSESQLQEFRRDGFLVIRRFYSPAEIASLSEAIDELTSRPPEAGKQMAYFEDSRLEPGRRVLSRVEKFVEYQPALRELVCSEKMTGVVGELIGDKPVLFKEKVNFKLPGGGGFEPHQDIQPGWDEYAPYFLSVLVTIDDSTVENGCLELAAGHHTRGLIGKKWEPLAGDELKSVTFIPYPMQPGDVAFFDCFVPHQSKPNLTRSRRRNLYLTYNRASDGDHRERYFSDKRKSYPPDFEREPGKTYAFKV